MVDYCNELLSRYCRKGELQDSCLRISVPSVHLVSPAIMSTLTVHCQREDERAGHSPLYVRAKKMKALIRHTQAILRDSSSSTVS